MACGTCGAQVTELRRGRCWGCYNRWAEARPVGRGATCTVCFEKRRDQLKLVELHGRSLPLCHGCTARLMRLDDIPATIDGIRTALRRDRRTADKRNGTKVDHRIFPRERRVGERRGPDRGALGDDPQRANTVLADLSDIDEIIVELQEADMEEVEQTMVRGRGESAASPPAPPST
ncbi:MAG TPA: hypothetical protein VHJ20_11910 [Polyangia bacterium]|nr:hypothetical protein [Polyangia bacterium]